MIKNAISEFQKDKKEFQKKINQAKSKKEKIKLMIPNILTKSRILAPVIILPSFIFGNFIGVAIIAGILGLTDCFDGFLARKWNATSKYGQKLDAISDKLFAVGISIPILLTNPLMIISTIILEFIIGYINTKSYLKNNNPKSTLLGKFKTTVLYILLCYTYLKSAVNIPIILIGLTNILQFATAIEYYKIDLIKDEKKSVVANNIPDKKQNKSENYEKINKIRQEINEYKHLKESLLSNEEEKIKTMNKTL